MNQFYVNPYAQGGSFFSAGVQNDHANILRIKQFDILELAYFLSGKKVITAPTIPKMVKITDHLKLKSNTGAFPKPSIKRILTKIIAIPCSCFFIQSHSFVKFKLLN